MTMPYDDAREAWALEAMLSEGTIVRRIFALVVDGIIEKVCVRHARFAC